MDVCRSTTKTSSRMIFFFFPSIPLFPLFFGGIAYLLSGGTQRHAFPSTPERRNENINVNKYLLEWASNPQPVDLQAHFVPLRHDWPLDLNDLLVLVINIVFYT